MMVPVINISPILVCYNCASSSIFGWTSDTKYGQFFIFGNACFRFVNGLKIIIDFKLKFRSF